jgi:hypothetical protein
LRDEFEPFMTGMEEPAMTEDRFHFASGLLAGIVITLCVVALVDVVGHLKALVWPRLRHWPNREAFCLNANNSICVAQRVACGRRCYRRPALMQCDRDPSSVTKKENR